MQVQLPPGAVQGGGQLPVIYAHGPLASDGRMLQHDKRQATSLNLVSGSTAASSGSSESELSRTAQLNVRPGLPCIMRARGTACRP